MKHTRTNNATWIESQGRWQIQVQRDGIRRTFYSSLAGAAGKREANAKADAWLQSGITRGSKRVHAVASEWLETLKPSREMQSSASYVQYESIMRTKIIPLIGNRTVSDLSNGDIQRVIDAAARNGYAKKTLQNIRGTMVAFVKYCRKFRYTDLRVEDVEIPWDAPKVEKEILQPDALKILFSVNTRKGRSKGPREDYYVNAYRFQLVTGLRPGEMLARTKADVRDGYLYISTALNQYGEITKGKNLNATRRIKLTELALQILEDQAEAERKNGIASTVLFPDTDGGYLSERKLYKNWCAYQKSNGIDHISLYELRHTFVSVCTANVPENLLKMVVGHSKSMDTQGVYGHEVQGQLDTAAHAIDSSFTALLMPQ